MTIRRIFKKYPLRTGFACLFILSFIVLQLWNHYAPLQISDRNKKEISRIKVVDPEDLTFAVFGDNKGGYSVFNALLKDLTHRIETSFAIDVGDLVQNGKRGLFRRFLKEVQGDLAIPLITAIGNHDLNNGSSGTYQEIFGATYYSFSLGVNSFIVLDATTESGFDKTERHWLEEELEKAQASKNRFVFMHVPPFDPRGNGFNKCLIDGKDLLDLFRRYHVTHLFVSHIHGYFSGAWEGVPYTITGGAGGGLQGSDPEHFFHHYVTVRVYQGKVETVVRRIDAENGIALLVDIFEDYVLEWGLLVGAGILLLTVGLTIKNRGPSKTIPT
jgi:serine/threonine-protein phosphatase CPPED1